MAESPIGQPMSMELIAQKTVAYRQNFRLFAQEQLKLQGNPLAFWPCQDPLLQVVERQMAERGFARVVWLKARQVGACLRKSTKVLRKDLTWVSIDSVQVDDELVAVDEEAPFPPGRKLRVARVLGTRTFSEPVFRLCLDNGAELVATADHRFLSIRRGGTNTVWRHVKDTQVGDGIRFITAPWGAPDAEDGWAGGMLDGEGSCRNKTRAGAEVTLTQLPGPVLDRFSKYLSSRGYTFRESVDVRPATPGGKFSSKPIGRVTLGRIPELFRLVGVTRPTRFLHTGWWEGKTLPGRGRGADTAWASVVSIEPLGVEEVVDLQTTTGTFLAEGCVSHNSTLAQALVAWRAMLWPFVNAIVIADESERSKGLFEISRGFYDHLDDWIRPVGRYATKRELVFANPNAARRTEDPGLRSRIVVESAHKKNVAIGAEWKVAHLSECARFRDPSVVIDGIIPAVHRVPGTMVIMESTAEMAGTWFRDFCERSQAGDTAFEFCFVPWFLQPEYYVCPVCDKTYPPGCLNLEHRATPLPDLSGDERHMMAEYGLQYGHIKWMRSKFSEMANDWNLFRQNYPLCPEDAWVTPGTQVFPSKQLHELRRGITPPIRRCEIYPGPRILDSPGGRLLIWEEPRPGVAYDIGLDVAQGAAESEQDAEDYLDYSVACVLERGTNRQVAEWASKAVDAFALATMVYWLGLYYNTAQLAVETNGIGGGTNAQLAKMGYPNLYIWRYRDEAVPRYTKKTGWETNRRTKSWLVGFVVHEMLQGRVQVSSELLLKEMETFVQKDIQEWGAIAGRHDDRVMAWGIALLTSDDENFERYYGLQRETNQAVALAGTPKIVEPEPWMCDRDFLRGKKRGFQSQEMAPWAY